jgi:hypothetical protein
MPPVVLSNFQSVLAEILQGTTSSKLRHSLSLSIQDLRENVFHH